MYPIELAIQNFKQFLRTDSISERDIPFIKTGLARLPFFAVPIFKRQLGRVFRVSVNNRIFKGEQKRIDELKYLRNPDKSIVKKMGRANLVNQTVLYGGFEPMTILNELKPDVGDLITVTEWQLNTGVYLNVAPIFKKMDTYDNNELSVRLEIDYINATRHLGQQEREQREILLSFLSDCFAKPVGQEHTDYYLSAHFANYMFNEFENGAIDVILYPSVQMDGSFMNIAMDSEVFRKNYGIKEISESEVIVAKHDKRQYQLAGISTTQKVNAERIIWT